jgi:GR25 family glycosyltransferase involved in LPS biosynthesis
MQILNETLHPKYDLVVDKAYIITIRGHETSEKLASRCLESCKRVGQKAEIYDAFDGTDPNVEGIKVPEHCQDATWLKWLRLVNHELTKPEVCCLLSHFSLWCKCIEQNRPLIVLEHDAVMLQPFTEHQAVNAIIYLGCNEQVRNNFWSIIPPHAQLNPDYRHILRTHAYSIDPFMAKNLVSHVLEKGIFSSADVTISLNRFAMLCFGIYAMDVSGESTIPEKGKEK